MTKHLDVWPGIFASCLIAVLSWSSPVLADGITQSSWNPFMFRLYCSSCGPSTPLTLEQADAVETLVGPPGGGWELGPPVFGPNDLVSPPLPVDTREGAGQHEDVRRDGAGTEDGLEYTIKVTGTHSDQGAQSDQGENDDVASNEDNDQDENGTSHATVTFTSTHGNDGDAGDNPISTNTVSGGGQAGESLAPEPTSLLLFGSGLGILSLRLRRKSDRS